METKEGEEEANREGNWEGTERSTSSFREVVSVSSREDPYALLPVVPRIIADLISLRLQIDFLRRNLIRKRLSLLSAESPFSAPAR